MSVKQLVKNVLFSGEVDKIKHFTVGGFTLAPCYYKGLAGYISMFDSPQVIYNSNYDGTAEYFPKSNRLYIGFQSTLYSENKGMIIHEATHAVCDMLGIQILRGDSEVLAYVAQCQYMRANFGDYRLEDSSDPIMDEIFKKAWAIATTIQNDNTPSESDYADLRQEISKHPYYSRSAEPAAYDGI
jgi:hypothetical protein